MHAACLPPSRPSAHPPPTPLRLPAGQPAGSHACLSVCPPLTLRTAFTPIAVFAGARGARGLTCFSRVLTGPLMAALRHCVLCMQYRAACRVPLTSAALWPYLETLVYRQVADTGRPVLSLKSGNDSRFLLRRN